MKTTGKREGDLAFSGIKPSGHKIAMDAAEEAGGYNTGQGLQNCYCTRSQGYQD
ncbi:hypothetical protein SAMN05443252_103219 [Bacillus sp. OV322]|uniref:hypothetical protein n=1 Tax=Bacillus sp. OV322 TaxID=1882764 RepID=UPI0008ED0BD8|nr:hypothetical protein [Bacillus sp. OV322]SFC39795.1 hypothetical protein SAMN05443252_103219 [Bacillus sp. OV322]